MVFCVVNRSCGETRGSSCSRRRKASIFSLGQSERLAKVRWLVFLPSRQPSRRRMAGGELRLGTTAIYMRTLTNINPNLSIEIYRYMRTQINENQVAVRAKPHIFKILTSNRDATVGWNFGLTHCPPGEEVSAVACMTNARNTETMIRRNVLFGTIAPFYELTTTMPAAKTD